MDPPRGEIDQEIRTRAEAGDIDAATTAALRCYGPEIYRFLIAFNGGEAAAADVFSLFSEGVWRGIGAFDWRHSLRSWAFGIARKASLRHRRDRGRRAAREMPVEAYSQIEAIAADIRSRTRSFLRTETKNRFAELRDDLPPDDRALLILRVDQKLSFIDCALAMRDEDDAGELGEDDLKREAARLRKRFQLLKERLLEVGRAEGLVGRSR